MRDLQAGRPEALEAIYDRYSPSILALCRRMLRDDSEAEEVLEQVLWELWSRADRYDASRGNPLSYLLLLARSRSLDRIRARQRQASRVVVVGGLGELERLAAGDGSDTPLDHTLLAERRTRVRAALESLDARQRQVIEMAFFDGLTHREISEHLGLPLGTVKTRIRRGLGVLHGALRLPSDPGGESA